MDKTKRAIYLQSLRVFSIVLLVIAALVAYVGMTTAWFSLNRRVHSNGMQVRGVDGLKMGEGITVHRYYTDDSFNNRTPSVTQYYRVDGEGYCFATGADFGSFLLDPDGARIPFAMDTMLPGERIEITFKIIRPENAKPLGEGYDIYFDSLSSDTVLIGEDYYSILGIYASSVRVGAGVYPQTKFLIDYDGEYPDGYQLHKSTGNDHVTGVEIDTSTVTVPRVTIHSGLWGSSSELSVTVLLHIDLTQYAGISGAETNMLSEKTLGIGSLVLAPREVE